MKKLLIILFAIIISAELKSQQVPLSIQGSVSFVASQNVYVRFKSTAGLSQGDTLYISANGKTIPALVVTNLSSTSCICTTLSNLNLTLSQAIIAIPKQSARSLQKPVVTSPKVIPQPPAVSDTTRKKVVTNLQKQKINGSLAAYSYSTYSNTAAPNLTQLRYTFILDAKNIDNSKFSVNTYISFRHTLGQWSAVQKDVFSALKIYDLSVTYDPSKTTHFTLGRRINFNISSMGAMDGLQFDKTINRFGFGIVAGFRPDFSNYGFNSKLPQFGAYMAYNSKPQETFHQTSVAIMEQMNNSKTDRRFLYFQHTNMVIKNLYFFGTFEADLYKVKNNLPQNTFDFTSLYLSLRLNITKSLTLTSSYDARKNVTYYETYKSLLDSVLLNQTRQSIRLQINYRITNSISVGVQSDYSFLKSDPTKTKNIYGYLTFSRIPRINISTTLSGTYLQSAFLSGKILQARLTRDLFKDKLQTEIGYQYIDYRLPESQQNILQNVGEVGIYWQVAKKMSFSVNYEGTFEKKDTFTRVYLQLRKRF